MKQPLGFEFQKVKEIMLEKDLEIETPTIMEFYNTSGQATQIGNPRGNVLCLGYQKQAGGEIVVTNVLTFKFPYLYKDQLDDFSFALERFCQQYHFQPRRIEPSPVPKADYDSTSSREKEHREKSLCSITPKQVQNPGSEEEREFASVEELWRERYERFSD